MALTSCVAPRDNEDPSRLVREVLFGECRRWDEVALPKGVEVVRYCHDGAGTEHWEDIEEMKRFRCVSVGRETYDKAELASCFVSGYGWQACLQQGTCTS